MTSQGIHLEGLVPEPETGTDVEGAILCDSIAEKPTDSHALAFDAPVAKGADHADLGWNQDPEYVRPLVDGLTNEDHWVLVRRFNKQVFYLQETAKPQPSGLDLNLSDEAEFSPNKLRSQFERMYMGPLLGLLAAVKHVSRLRSWLEPQRTGVFCTVYFVAWFFNILIMALTGTMMCLILSPRARTILFPPAPMSMVGWISGGLTKPPAGVLGSTGAVTGAPENIKGETIENEASNFVTGVAGIAVNTLTAQDPKSEPENQKGESHPTDSMPQPNEATTLMAVAKDKAAGVDDPSQDKTKHPMETVMWSKMLPLLRLLYTVSDTWERFANALSPTPPFTQRTHRVRLASVLAPMLLTSILVPSYVILKAATFTIGVGLFGDPILRRAIQLLDRRYPGWESLLRPENSILKGVPTDAQLAISILRIGEVHESPLPPSPHVNKGPPMVPVELSKSNLNAIGSDTPLGVTQEEFLDAAAPDEEAMEEAGGPASEIKNMGGRKTTRLLGLLKAGAKASVHTALGADKLRAKAGRQSAKNRIGVVPSKKDMLEKGGPSEFSAYHAGKKGHIHVRADGLVSFDSDWSLQVGNIRELKKHTAVGVKSKLAVGWALERDASDGLEIKDRAGKAYILSGIQLRDQLFNRLCAMGGQKWEVY